MATFYTLIALYVASGLVAGIVYREQVKMHIGLMMTVARYDAPDFLTEGELYVLVVTAYVIALAVAWPVIIQQLDQLK